MTTKKTTVLNEPAYDPNVALSPEEVGAVVTRDEQSNADNEATDFTPLSLDHLLASLRKFVHQRKQYLMSWIDKYVIDFANGTPVEQTGLADALHDAGLTVDQFEELCRKKVRRFALVAEVARDPEYDAELRDADQAVIEFRTERRRRIDEFDEWAKVRGQQLDVISFQRERERRVNELRDSLDFTEGEINRRQASARAAVDSCRQAKTELMRTSHHSMEYASESKRLREETSKLEAIGNSLDRVERHLVEIPLNLQKMPKGDSPGRRNSEKALNDELQKQSGLKSQFDQQQRVVDGLATRVAELAALVMEA